METAADGQLAGDITARTVLTRQKLREQRTELNQRDAAKLAELFMKALCMHRIITEEGYKYCARPGMKGTGRFVFCTAHRET